ncbi:MULTISPECIES: DNA-3-methyladenine glycosylase I [unclassified Brenneria]|uniref:DNA-3-methyladenine glycosylase I n=1 Tax=unclassified Brenneria TaxID=2634434 RepID=UPI001555A9B1|nr:DNA-3-methyladenine glycosylase I [Brenneria sp. hezel4-2-4]MEE3652161.1 DNA-3-methyladenine glycosylase I [Brenneria sp. HEZEL_4_2_4]NPD02120.1 DNA-3-methyladenine glycosylase I [Brenneria sp. hezel4-2-4]
MNRCGWVTQDALYQAYHDNEWGKPCTDSQKLFELLCLEGQQAGLSWITVLKKRENYRRCFRQFDPGQIAQMTQEDVDKLMQDSGIIRHRGKITAIITNARAWLEMENQGESFSRFIWSFVDHQPQLNRPTSLADVPAKTAISDAMSKALKKRGFKFIGSTICYAFMQAGGLVNDHTIDCFRRQETET